MGAVSALIRCHGNAINPRVDLISIMFFFYFSFFIPFFSSLVHHSSRYGNQAPGTSFDPPPPSERARGQRGSPHPLAPPSDRLPLLRLVRRRSAAAGQSGKSGLDGVPRGGRERCILNRVFVCLAEARSRSQRSRSQPSIF